MDRVFKAWIDSPIGLVEIVSDDIGITSVEFVDRRASGRDEGERESGAAEARASQGLDVGNDGPAAMCAVQLAEYFSGARRRFDAPIHLRGTPFQMKAWEALLAIPFGKTATYKDIAAAVGNPKSTRAVGGANHHNPVSIIVPCHRVIGCDGRLTGYGSGLWRKEWLLAHERKHAGY